MVVVKFQYRDDFSNGEWREQECVVNTVKECKEIYGLGVDCDYRIISVKNIQKEKRGRVASSSFNSFY